MDDGRIEGCTVEGDFLLCVFDDPEFTSEDCNYAKKLVAEAKGRDDCQYWKPDAVKDDCASDELAALRAQVSALQTENEGLYLSNVQTQKHADELLDKLHEAERQVDHWKKQHKNEVNRAYGLKGNAEIHQVRAYELMGELQGQVASLSDELARVKERAQTRVDGLKEQRDAAESERDHLRAEVEGLRTALTVSERSKGSYGVWEDLGDLMGTYTLELNEDLHQPHGTWAGRLAVIDSGIDLSDPGFKHPHGAQMRPLIEKLRGPGFATAAITGAFGLGLSQQLSTSYEKGAESMRERVKRELAELSEAGRLTYGNALDAIRALPLKENEG